MNSNYKIYDAIAVDVLNLLHKLYQLDNKASESKEELFNIGNKLVYRNLTVSFIEYIYYLRENFLKNDSSLIYLLYDPFYSKTKGSSTSIYTHFKKSKRKRVSASYKGNRAKLKISEVFYTTLRLLKYFFLNSEPFIKSVQIQNLEADDLIYPLIQQELDKDTKSKILLVTNDSDCYRYVSESVHFQPILRNPPEGIEYIYRKLGFRPSEERVVIYKTLLGDSADNIPAIIPTAEKQLLVDYLNKNPEDTLQDVIVKSRKYINKYDETEKFLYLVKANESQVKINEFLVRRINVDLPQFHASTCEGKQNGKIIKAINLLLKRDSLENNIDLKNFTFGNISVKRANTEEA